MKLNISLLCGKKRQVGKRAGAEHGRIVRCRSYLNLLCGITLLFFVSPVHAQWYQQNIPATFLNGIYFADSLNGWVVGTKTYHTTDGGDTWTIQNRGGSYIAGINKNECWVSGGNGILFHTKNAGESWDSTDVKGYLNLDSIRYTLGLYFVDSLKGWYVVRGWHQGIFSWLVMIKTQDGGKTWISENLSGNELDSESLTFSFVDSSYGWVAGYNILRTTNGGTRWDSISHVQFFTQEDMKFITREVGWMTVDGPEWFSSLMKTTDGGSSWYLQKQFCCSILDIYISFLDTLHGWVLANNRLRGTESWRTTDGGVTWDSSVINPTGFEPRRIFFVDSIHGWAIGHDGELYHTTTGGVLTVPDRNEKPENYFLYQNYPNPFNPVTIIRYQLPTASDVKLAIYNLLGQEMRVLVNEKRTAGSYSIMVDGSQYPSGVYFYKLETTNFTEIKKMVLIR